MKECPECGYCEKGLADKLAKKLYHWLGDAFDLTPRVKLTEEALVKLVNNHIEAHKRMAKGEEIE